ncbi:MAG: agmatine deiminase family protein [Bacteroidales bacterium]|nr:agmatine deiminase family protein [Bacteroidales bacterium]
MEHLVYISEYLIKIDRGKKVANAIEEAFGKRLEKIPSNSNEWCRDYMPVKASDGKLVLFKYMPSYLVGWKSYEKSIPEDQQAICRSIGLDFEECDVILDGGAIEIFGTQGIISDRVIKDNCSSWHGDSPTVLGIIKEKLKLKSLIVVPSDPWDFTGHVDGMVRFIDEKKVVVNDLIGLENRMKGFSIYEQELFRLWKAHFYNTLKDAELEIEEELPCEVHRNKDDKDATGIYLNFLLLDDVIIMPSYTQYEASNKKARIKLENLYKRRVIEITANDIAKHGGVINCVTWTN